MLRRTFWLIIIGISMVGLHFKINQIDLLPDWLGLMLVFGCLWRLQKHYPYFKRATWLSFFAIGHTIPWFESTTMAQDSPWSQYGVFLGNFFYGIFLWMIGEISYGLIRYQRLAEPERSNRPLVVSYLGLVSHAIFIVGLVIWPSLAQVMFAFIALGIAVVAYPVLFFYWLRYAKRLNAVDFGDQQAPRFAYWLKGLLILVLIVPLLGLSSTRINPTNPLWPNEPVASLSYQQQFRGLSDMRNDRIAYSPDGSMLALINEEFIELPEKAQTNARLTVTKLYIFDMVDYTKQRVITLDTAMFTENIAWNHTSSQIFISSTEYGEYSTTYIIDVAKSEIILTKTNQILGGIDAVRWNPDNRNITLLASSIWQLDSLTGDVQLVSDLVHNPDFLEVAISPDAQYAVYRTIQQDRLSIYRLSSGMEYTNLQQAAGGVGDLSWSNNQKLIAVSKRNHMIQVWDAASGELLYNVLIDYQIDHWWTKNGYAVPATSVSFSPDSRLIAAGNEDGTIIVWQVADGQRVIRFEQHQAPITSIAINPNNQQIASTDQDGKLLIWDITKVVQ